ncbi:hypothetical protein SAMN05444920_1374 [Nonomuraea solani]|uniref:PT repeat-containing protein n=1 Tax=Nonomuraea solani TaxID=1144553 RepID=A0A1H6F3C1_9ACTN|nr:hypothetical protein [Nonomuraea solani]SEH03444.1 hypothetical protein SAMN05444920_1374 [Nonomuraea solani]
MRGRVLIALAAVTLLLAGCGADEGGSDVASRTGNGTGNQAASSAKPSEDPREKMLKYAQCMRENGVDMPDPDPNQGGVMFKLDKDTSQETMQKAQEVCKQHQPSGQRADGGDPKRAEAMRKVAQCMRDNGVEDYPDPEGNTVRINGDVDQDPDFKAAQEKCQKEAAEAGMGGS